MSPNHRPFFSNFLAAFRAQQAAHKVVTSTTTSTSSATASFSTASTLPTHITTSATSTTAAVRSIATKSTTQILQPPTSSQTPSNNPSSTAVAIQTSSGTFQPARHHSTSPYSRSPSPGYSPGATAAGFGNGGMRARRGSDSSNEGGFRDVMGADKWYIGGRTAAGEERFYKLSMVRRPRSVDRLSIDRMSL